MKQKLFAFTLLFIILFYSGCTKKYTSIEDFFEGDFEKIDAKEIVVKNAFFHDPSEIVLYDTLMLLKDKCDNYAFSLIDLKNNVFLNRFGNLGRGPNELGIPEYLTYNKEEKSVSFIDLMYQKYLSAKIEEFESDEVIFTEKFKIDHKNRDIFLDFVPVWGENTRYIGCGRIENGMFGICNIHGEIDTVIGEYTVAPEHENIRAHLLGDAFQGAIKSHPKKPKVVYVSYRHDLMKIINMKDDTYNIEKFYIDNDNYPTLQKFENNLATKRDDPRTFGMPYTTDEFIYVPYLGKSIVSIMSESESIGYFRYVYVFDWDLNPVISYELDQRVTTIAVSEDDKKLFSFVSNENGNEIILAEWELSH